MTLQAGFAQRSRAAQGHQGRLAAYIGVVTASGTLCCHAGPGCAAALPSRVHTGIINSCACWQIWPDSDNSAT